MTQLQVEKELQKIYGEMKGWPEINKGLNYIIPKREVARREAVLSLEQILYKIEEARKKRDKSEEYFNLASYYLTKLAAE